jgi:DNA-binding CsgD family transcriptional regulator
MATAPALAARWPLVARAREREVAALAARGGTSREIARQLHLSTRTVDNHLQNAFHKLGVTRRADLERALANQAL